MKYKTNYLYSTGDYTVINWTIEVPMSKYSWTFLEHIGLSPLSGNRVACKP